MIKKSLFVWVSFIFCLNFISLNVIAETKRSIIVLGDSLSAGYGMKKEQGWVALANQHYQNKNLPYHIINASISGETTAGGLARLPKLLNNENVDLIIVELGGNDGLRGFPPKLMKNNLLQMISLAQKKETPIALMQIKIPPNYGPQYTKLFTNTFEQVAKKTKTYLLPFFIDNIATNPKLMQADKIHPNIKAQPLMADIMINEINKIIHINENK